MDEPDSPYRPPNTPTPPPLAGDDGKGSLWLGFGLFWLVLIGGSFVAPLLYALMNAILPNGSGRFPTAIASLSLLLPWLLELVLAIWLSKKGRMRTAKGVGLGFLSLIGLGVLLVAACFGLIAFNR